nr:VCBS domain-containing protein [Allomuricauda sp.]
MKRLKIQTLSLCSLLVLALMGCSSDDGNNGSGTNTAVVGQWDLIEVNISSAQDIDQDGNSSTNLMDELDCITGTLTLNADGSWSFSQSNVVISSLTNNEFFAECSGTTSGVGTWDANNVQVVFVGSSVLSSMQIGANNTLLNNIDEDLPGIDSFVYQQR